MSPVHKLSSAHTLIHSHSPHTHPHTLTLTHTPSHPHTHTQVIYSLANDTSSTTTSTFSVDQLSGVITLLQTLDFETRQQYMFQVEARDNSSIPMSSFVTIT